MRNESSKGVYYFHLNNTIEETKTKIQLQNTTRGNELRTQGGTILPSQRDIPKKYNETKLFYCYTLTFQTEKGCEQYQ